jgi:hypothetical protein
MSNVNWSFLDFVQWVRAQGEALERLGAGVELHVQESGRPSVRLRVERGKCLGELTVWGDGTAHMAIVDIQSGEFVFERDGVSVDGSAIESGLKEFFDRVERGE